MNWKELAKLVMEAHAQGGSSITFVHSGMSALYYSRFGVAMEGEQEVPKLTAKTVRGFLWERFRKYREPGAVPRTWLVITARIDGSDWVGVGRFTRAKEVA